MGFLTPSSLWLGGFLAVLILFYLFRKEFTEKEISSTILWDHLVQEWKANRWWRKLQRHLLLLLQILIVCLLVLAMAQPFYTGSGISGSHVVVVLDPSASMGAREGEATRFQAAKEAVLDMVDSLGSGQQMSLLAAGKVPQLLFCEETDKNTMKRKINELEATFEEDNMIQAAGYATSLAPEGEGEIHLFTDSLKKEELKKVPSSHKFVVHNIGKQMNNLSLRAFGAAEKEGTITGVLTIANESEKDTNVSVSIEGDGGSVAKNILVKAEAAELLYINDLAPSAFYEAIITNEDDYQADNTISAILGDSASAEVYLAGETNPFLEKVLPLLGYDPVVLSENEEGEILYPDDGSGVYILSGIEQEDWPAGPKFILSPVPGGSLNVGEEIETEEGLSVEDSHPLLSYVEMEDVYLQSRKPFTSSSLESIVWSGDEPVISSGTYEGSPMVMAAMDLEDSDWPLQPGFPIFIKNALHYLQEENQTLGYASPNEEKQVSFSSDSKAAEIFDPLTNAVSDKVELNSDSIRMPGTPGIYALKETSDSGTRDRYFAVLLSEKEQTIASEESFAIGGSRSSEEDDSTKSIHPLWKWAALLAFILLILEWEVYRRGITT
ncbi:VWA domain-containing protein [Rossellomorea vietnamensis]|uniref:VWA domain-containing protein n=1 Tax=Rossellomorea vietnamensis TaxID=218284 RepID=A0A5D4KBG4_9BACI|nr:BatA and WFA domain-containing protein [Rossellomorea vietnamensis]TYR74219.1 VWA domain-containing protein [Rossellomorea vietnamensis]